MIMGGSRGSMGRDRDGLLHGRKGTAGQLSQDKIREQCEAPGRASYQVVETDRKPRVGKPVLFRSDDVEIGAWHESIGATSKSRVRSQ